MVAEKQVLIPLSACFFVSILLILNFLFNMMRNLVQTTFSDVFEPQPFHLETSFLTEIHLQQYMPLYGAMCLVTTLLTAKFAYNIRSNFKDLNHNQKGSGRFTTRSELKKQYRKVSEKTTTYQGGGGVPVSRIQTYDLIQTWKE